MKKVKKGIVIILICIISIPLVLRTASLVIMHFVSSDAYDNSPVEKLGIKLDIPGGLSTFAHDWAPEVLVFHPSGFGSYTGDGSDLTVYYNYPAYSPLHLCSNIYDKSSPYYCGFYGAYIVNGDYGFNASIDGSYCANIDDIQQIPVYDYKYLVLANFGLKSKDFYMNPESVSVTEEVKYAGLDGWTLVDASFKAPGVCHKPSGFASSYVQYGVPTYSCDSDFDETALHARMYIKYFPEKSCSVCFYIVAAGMDVIESCDKEILSHSELNFID